MKFFAGPRKIRHFKVQFRKKMYKILYIFENGFQLVTMSNGVLSLKIKQHMFFFLELLFTALGKQAIAKLFLKFSIVLVFRNIFNRWNLVLFLIHCEYFETNKILLHSLSLSLSTMKMFKLQDCIFNILFIVS